MKKFFVVSLLLIGMMFAAGCSSSQQNAQTPQPPSTPAAPAAEVNKIVVGLDESFPPMGFRDEATNELVGFDIDLATEVANRIDMEVEFKPIDWDSKELELSSKRVDVLWNGLTITDARKEIWLITKPYLENRQIITVNKDSDIKTKSDLADKTIGVQKGSTAVDAVQEDVETYESLKGLSEYANNIDAYLDLEIGRIDAMVLDEIVAKYYMVKNPDKFIILDEYFSDEQFGVATRLEDTELNAKIQAALDEMTADGTGAAISEKWFGEDKLLQ